MANEEGLNITVPIGVENVDNLTKPLNSQMEFQKFVEQNVGDKAFGLRTLGTAENILSAPSSGFGGEYDARNLPILKDMGFVTQALFNTIAPYGEKAFDIVDTLFRLPGAAVADIAELTGSSESDVNKLQAEINTMVSLIVPQGNPTSTAAATNQVVNAVSKSAKELNNVRKFIPEMLEGQYSLFASPKAKSVGAKAVDQRPVGVKLASEMSDEPLNVMSISRDRKQKLANVSKKRAEGMQGKVLEYMKSMDPNDILKMTDNELLDLLESKLGFRSTANTIYRSKKKLGITTKRGEKLTKRSGGSLTMALENMGDMKKNMTLDEISKFLKDKYNVDASSTTLYQRLKKGDYVSKKTMGSSEIVRDALLKLDSLENVTLEQIKNIPEIKNLNLTKAALNTAISNARKTPGLEDFKIVKTKKPDFIEKLVSEGKINKQELDNFLAANPSISNSKLLEKFPILKNFDPQSIMRYRRQQGFSRRDNPETPPKIQLIGNPTLDRRLQYVRNIEELYGDNINDKTIKVIKAHALGEGKVIDLNPKDIVALENKIKYIPEEFIDDTIKRPSFFLTSSGNDAHRVIENNLINTLVDKYQKLGYKFVDNPKMPWKKPSKEIDLSLSKNKDLANEIKDLNKKIEGFKKDLSDMDAFTLFYNPIKGKMVSYGKPVSEVPGLANIVTRIKKGELDLKDGGMVSIFEMTRPINAQR
jgi:hypothetical protein